MLKTPQPLPTWYHAWAAWRAAGAPKGQRPSNAPRLIPLWAWALYKATHPTLPKWSMPFYAQQVYLCAQDCLTAMQAPRGSIPALSLDPAYAGWNTPAAVAALRTKFYRVAGWYVPGEIDAAAARTWARQLGLDYVIVQAETAAQYDLAMEQTKGTTVVLVGNPNAWTDAQRADATARCDNNTMALIFETYTNEGWPWPDQSSSQGVPAASLCIGLYHGAAGYITAAEYKAHTSPGAWRTLSIYYTAGVATEDDWHVLETL